MCVGNWTDFIREVSSCSSWSIFSDSSTSCATLTMNSKQLSRPELEDLVRKHNSTVTYAEKKKLPSLSHRWEHIRQVFVHEVQQNFVFCTVCKSILSYTSANETKVIKDPYTSHRNSRRKERNKNLGPMSGWIGMFHPGPEPEFFHILNLAPPRFRRDRGRIGFRVTPLISTHHTCCGTMFEGHHKANLLLETDEVGEDPDLVTSICSEGSHLK